MPQTPPTTSAWLPLTKSGACRLCLQLEEERPVTLRESPEAIIYAAALLDAAAVPFAPMEVWLQRRSPAPVFSIGRPTLTNATADERWHLLRAAMEATQRSQPPTFCPPQHPQPPVWLGLPEELSLAVSTDNAELQTAGWPAYADSTTRALKITSPDGSASWWGPDGRGDWAPPTSHPWNAECGHWFALPSPGCGLDTFLTAISRGHAPGAERLRHADTLYLTGWRGEIPPLPEILFLKLKLLHGALTATATAQEVRRAPLLDITPRSFAVATAPDSAAWLSHVSLRAPGAALLPAVGISGAEPLFILPAEMPLSIYLHPSCRPARTTPATLRLRALPEVDGHGQTTGEGTLLLPGPLPALGDSVLIAAPDIAAAPLHAAITSVEPSRGELGIRLRPWKPLTELRQPPPLEIHAALIPRLGAGADLYALGVTALEALLCGSGQPLATVLDEALRLIRRIDAMEAPPEDTAALLTTWFRKESTEPWALVFTATHLAATSHEEAERIPSYAWWSTITWALRLLSGQWKHAWLRDAGDDTPHAPHLALTAPLAELQKLVTRARALVTIDWTRNIEIRERILAALTR